MDDLITWLRAQLDEDERIATRDGVLAGDTWQVLEPLPGRVTAEVMRVGGTVAKLEEHDAEHIARHDPARVLREVEAKREITNACAGTLGGGVNPGAMCDADLVLRLLALPYSDRPGYREAWKP